MNEQQQHTHVAVPGDVFAKVMNVVTSLPYNQVERIVEEVKNSAQGVSFEKAEENDEKEKKDKK